jgi:Tol biopolymer transport system component
MRRIGTLLFLALAVGGLPAEAQNATTRVSVSSFGAQGNGDSLTPAISADGRFVAFHSSASNLVLGDTNNQTDVFVRNRLSGATERVSLPAFGTQADGNSFSASISEDGRFVAFTSGATNLVQGDTNEDTDIFVRDRQEGTTTRVSVSSTGIEANGRSDNAFISADGRYVAFTSEATNLVPGDTNNYADVFRHDRLNQATVRVSVGAVTLLGGITQADGLSGATGISDDGQVVSFYSDATNLLTSPIVSVASDKNGERDVFVRSFSPNVTRRVSIGTGGIEANAFSAGGSISGDGRFVVFDSSATNLVPNSDRGLYVHDRESGVTSALHTTGTGTIAIFSGQISDNGRYVCFKRIATSGAPELLVVDRVTLATTRVSVALGDDPANANSFSCALSADASVAAFDSAATNLVVGDTNGKNDIFARTPLGTIALEKTELTFGATTSAGTFVSHTTAQTLRLTQSGAGTVTWTATSTQPWLHVSPSSGSASGVLSISLVPGASVPASGTINGYVHVSVGGLVNALPGIKVTLTLTPAGTSLGPFGTVDSPDDNRTGVTGAVPFTGWALDDLEVAQVSICRAAFGAEVAPVDSHCGDTAEIFVGFAVFIDGARPDVPAAFPMFPRASRAGWGFMVLTNMLPNQGNGTYRFTMRAQDREGHWSVLGRRTMTATNASATLPFGTIDTPGQGETIFGSSFVNFGWALTPLPKIIPVDGSTIQVWIDGVNVGTANYNNQREDIQKLFPGLNNTNGAVGFRILDTTRLTNGLHEISWVVTDNQGAMEGLGSRFFTVANGVTASSADPKLTSRATRDTPLDTTPIIGRRGWDLAAPLGSFGAGASGVTVIRSEEVSRVELQLGEGDYSGYLRTSDGLAPLPIGSQIDRASNTFTWAPGVGFIGRYDFVFLRSANDRAISRRDVRILIHPKGRGAVGPQVVIDLPRPTSTVGSPFFIGGWAVDLDAPEGEGTGVTTLHAWAYPAAGGPPIFLGATGYGGARPDVAAVHGDQFKDSGFGLIAQGLPAGDYDLALFAWSTETMGFVAPTTVRVTVRP